MAILANCSFSFSVYICNDSGSSGKLASHTFNACKSQKVVAQSWALVSVFQEVEQLFELILHRTRIQREMVATYFNF